MKRSIYILVASSIFSLMVLSSGPLSAQEPPHPPSTGHGVKGNQAPGSTAPIDGGLSILLAMGLIYGSKKFSKKEE